MVFKTCCTQPHLCQHSRVHTEVIFTKAWLFGLETKWSFPLYKRVPATFVEPQRTFSLSLSPFFVALGAPCYSFASSTPSLWARKQVSLFEQLCFATFSSAPELRIRSGLLMNDWAGIIRTDGPMNLAKHWHKHTEVYQLMSPKCSPKVCLSTTSTLAALLSCHCLSPPWFLCLSFYPHLVCADMASCC